jgi:hypothetical protein
VPCGEVDAFVGWAGTVAFCGEVRAMLTFWPDAEAVLDIPAAVATFCARAAALSAVEAAGRGVADAWTDAELEATAGVERGGAAVAWRVAGSVWSSEGPLAVGAGLAGLAASSAERGGASRSSSRAVAGALAGWRPGVFALSVRRFIRGISDTGLSKLNSIGSELGSAGEGLSGMAYSEITAPDGNSKT